MRPDGSPGQSGVVYGAPRPPQAPPRQVGLPSFLKPAGAGWRASTLRWERALLPRQL